MYWIQCIMNRSGGNRRMDLYNLLVETNSEEDQQMRLCPVWFHRPFRWCSKFWWPLQHLQQDSGSVRRRSFTIMGNVVTDDLMKYPKHSQKQTSSHANLIGTKSTKIWTAPKSVIKCSWNHGIHLQATGVDALSMQVGEKFDATQ